MLIKYSINTVSDKSTEVEILDAAGAVLAERGFGGFTTQAVADEAGVSQGLVHHYFGTKQGLLQALFEWGFEDVAAEIETRVEGGGPREKLLELAEYLIVGGESFEEAVDVARITLELQNRAVHDDDLRQLVEQERSRLSDLVTDIVRRGVETGVFRPVDPDAFASVYLGAVEAGEHRRAIHADPDVCRTAYRRIVEVVDSLLVETGGDEQPEDNS